MNRRGIAVGAGLVLVLVVAAPFAYRAVKQYRACGLIEANHAAASVTTGHGTPAFVLGDSYSSGWLLRNAQRSWAHDLGRIEGWRVTVNATMGSGFVATSPCGGDAFAARAQVPRGTRVVIVEGGLNDAGRDVAVPARTVLAAIERQAPDARVIVVGPPTVPARNVVSVAAELRQAARQAGAQYVDTSGWSLPVASDGLHLKPAGHERFARLVADQITG